MKMIEVKGKVVEFIERKGGWTTFLDENGIVRKARNGDVKEVSQAKVARVKKEEHAANGEAAPKRKPKTPAELAPRRIGESPVRNLPTYVRAYSASGNHTLDCGDAVAEKLRGKSLDEVFEIAAETLGESVTALRAKYSHLNDGMIRMNLGNRMRGALRKAAKAEARA